MIAFIPLYGLFKVMDFTSLMKHQGLDNELSLSLLTTCSRLVIIKPEQATRTHPDIDLKTVRQQACRQIEKAYWINVTLLS